MSKTSGWFIVATEGATIDGREISTAQIKEMGESYSTDVYAALIWPEHARSHWNVFEGNNWGEVPEVKAEKRAGKLRLLAKITPNEHLLDANKKNQKLYTSIEIEPNFQNTGKAYLAGLGVTDSPASTGTTRLKFSRKENDSYEIETDSLEQIDISEFYSTNNKLAQAFSTIANYFSSGGEMPKPEETIQEDIDVDEEKLVEILGQQFSKQFGSLKTDLKKELKEELVAELEEKFVKQPQDGEQETPEVPEKTGIDADQFAVVFSKAFEEGVKPFKDQLDAMDEKFNKLSKEVPGQEPHGAGAPVSTEFV